MLEPEEPAQIRLLLETLTQVSALTSRLRLDPQANPSRQILDQLQLSLLQLQTQLSFWSKREYNPVFRSWEIIT